MSARTVSLRNLLLVLLGFLLASAVGEIGIRIIYGAPIAWREPQVKHERVSYGYRMIPHQKGFSGAAEVRVNSQGFRGAEWSFDSGEDKVLILGDSITFGSQIEEPFIYPTLLGRELSQQGMAVSTLNASVMGWSTFHQLDFLAEFIDAVKPSAIVIAFFYNDFNIRERIEPTIIIRDGVLDGRPSALRWVPYRGIYWIKNSALVSFVRNAVSEVAYRWRSDDDSSFFKQLLTNQLDLDRDRTVQVTLDYLRTIFSLCEARGIPVILLNIPPLHYVRAINQAVGYANSLAAVAEGRATFIDLTEAFRAQGQDLYLYPWDNHLSAKGHRAVADGLLPALQSILASQPGSAGAG